MEDDQRSTAEVDVVNTFFDQTEPLDRGLLLVVDRRRSDRQKLRVAKHPCTCNSVWFDIPTRIIKRIHQTGVDECCGELYYQVFVVLADDAEGMMPLFMGQVGTPQVPVAGTPSRVAQLELPEYATLGMDGFRSESASDARVLAVGQSMTLNFYRKNPSHNDNMEIEFFGPNGSVGLAYNSGGKDITGLLNPGANRCKLDFNRPWWIGIGQVTFHCVAEFSWGAPSWKPGNWKPELWGWYGNGWGKSLHTIEWTWNLG